MSESDSESVVLPDGAMCLDASHFPVLLVTWFGMPGPELVDHYVEWLGRMGDRARAEGTRLTVIGDTTGWQARPGPEVRRAMVAAIERIQAQHPGVLLGVTTIIGQPVMRAVITMVLALTRQKIDLRPVKSFEQAIERTFGLLDGAGIPRPAGLDTASYRRPSWPQSPGKTA